MKVEDHINRRCADAAKKAGLLGVWPAKTSRRGEAVHTIVGEEDVRCGKCGKTSWGQHWSAVRERDGTDYADCPYCYTTLKLVGPGASGSKRLFSDRPHRVTDDGRIKCGSCGQTTGRQYWTEFGCGSEKFAACSYCGDSRELEGARRSRREGGLSMDEIEKLASRAGVKRVAVENFLMGVSPSTGRIDDHLANLEMDARLYKWNAATVAAIRAGISKAYH